MDEPSHLLLAVIQCGNGPHCCLRRAIRPVTLPIGCELQFDYVEETIVGVFYDIEAHQIIYRLEEEHGLSVADFDIAIEHYRKCGFVQDDLA